MKIIRRLALTLPLILGVSTPALSWSAVHAAPVSGTPVTQVEDSTTVSTHLSNIKSKGDQEIARRLASLGTLAAKISAATKLTTDDRAALTDEVSNEMTGLSDLKTTLDGETTVAAAITDAKNIISEYRVYALVLPKVQLVKTADDQQVVEGKLTALAAKLQTRIAAAQTAGKDITALQTKLTDMNAQIAAASAISSSIETKVVVLQPSDYNTDHSILNGDAAQLKTAHQDNQAAYQDAKSIIDSLKSL